MQSYENILHTGLCGVGRLDRTYFEESPRKATPKEQEGEGPGHEGSRLGPVLPASSYFNKAGM